MVQNLGEIFNGKYLSWVDGGVAYRLDMANGIVETLDPSANTWSVVTSFDSMDSEEYAYGFNATTDRFYRVNKTTGDTDLAGASGWQHTFGTHGGAGDGTMASYDPLSTVNPTGGLTSVNPVTIYIDLPCIHTYDGQMYEMSTDTTRAAARIIRTLTLSTDESDFSLSEGVAVQGDNYQTNKCVYDTKEGSPLVAMVALDKDDISRTFFGLIDFSSGIPGDIKTVEIDDTIGFNPDAGLVPVKVARIDEDHYIVVAAPISTGAYYGGIVKITAGIPALLAPMASLGFTLASSYVNSLLGMNGTEAFLVVHNNSISWLFKKLTFDLGTGGITVTSVNQINNTNIGQSFAKIDDTRIAAVTAPGSSQFNFSILDFDTLTDIDTDAGFVLGTSNTATYSRILPETSDGYMMAVFDDVDEAYKIKIPPAGVNFELWPAIDFFGDIASLQSNWSPTFKLPDGRLGVYARASGSNIQPYILTV